ncbi:unnamed protein product [Prorocentrum cordatum]|uniref:Uncharacterized protein n=1 Tax=Prorocentrum cordatum TaxID=2364126 RepID=A0ABN9QQ48_9DINO|nr:unnamed protein product [Polarella glacialis]
MLWLDDPDAVDRAMKKAWDRMSREDQAVTHSMLSVPRASVPRGPASGQEPRTTRRLGGAAPGGATARRGPTAARC